ncbi:MAG: hypothetical protein OJJ54_06960 [Pseudonocardia sp.]|nr:hypothetical protein [Pseudonocardia sp.]
MTVDRARLVADAVLYEGYLLYPYRATSGKNQARWQFGVLAPAGAAAAGLGEESGLAVQTLLRPGPGAAVRVAVRCLQLQTRGVERAEADGGFTPVRELMVDGTSRLSWDEAVEQEVASGPFTLAELAEGVTAPIEIEGGEERETLLDATGAVAGRVVRRRRPLAATLRLGAEPDDGVVRLTAEVENTGPGARDAADAIRRSLIGTHLLLTTHDAEFLSVIDPPTGAAAAARRCRQRRCWPVLAGPPGQTDVVLGLPIILDDHPEIAPQSAGALFDSTEIDEILTLRVMTLTDDEKAQARATDPRAAAVIDRCERMTPEQMQGLHGVLRDPHAGTSTPTGDDWWAAEAAADVTPETDTVVVAGVPVGRGSLVRLHPSRRADAQDLFLADLEARVSGVHVDLDGETHVAVTLLDDPAADLHDWYGRYLYFAPDELEPLAGAADPDRREETTS